MTCFDMGGLVGALFVDLRKSFAVVDHSIMIKEILVYKIDKVSMKWFIPYLNNRKQVTDSDQGLSEFMRVKFGVPRGSVPCSPLFLLWH